MMIWRDNSAKRAYSSVPHLGKGDPGLEENERSDGKINHHVGVGELEAEDVAIRGNLLRRKERNQQARETGGIEELTLLETSS